MTSLTSLEKIIKNTRTVIPQIIVENRIAELRGRALKRVGELSRPVTFLVLGRGGHMFAQRLFYCMFGAYSVEYMYATTYGSGEEVGEFRSLFATANNYEGQHVIVVDDIRDTGTTQHNVRQICLEHGAVSVDGLFLLDKPSRRKFDDVPVLAVGFEISDIFIYGWGMDAYGFDALRRLTDISCLAENLPAEGPHFWLPK